jgi:hypothetical protein
MEISTLFPQKQTVEHVILHVQGYLWKLLRQIFGIVIIPGKYRVQP